MAAKTAIELSDKEKYFGEYYSKYNKHPVCPVCNEEIQRGDLASAEYIKTKSGTEFFAHRCCILGPRKEQ